MQAWRIATDTPDYTSDDLSGTGAKITGGRWNRVGLPMLYCASSVSLACLETMVHLGAGGLPLNRYLVSIGIPEDVWKRREEYLLGGLPVGWDAAPPGKVSLDCGDEWLTSLRSAVAVVPSSIATEDAVILINPSHPDAKAVTAIKTRRWLYDPRMFMSSTTPGR
jgi:RES domain-containing protein